MTWCDHAGGAVDSIAKCEGQFVFGHSSGRGRRPVIDRPFGDRGDAQHILHMRRLPLDTP